MINSNSQTIVKVKCLVPAAKIPKYQHPGDSGADLVAVAEHTLKSMQWFAISTGISVEVPLGFEMQVRPRSSLASKNGVTVLNTPGTIDSGYRGEIKVILLNLGRETFKITPGMKIAQLVIAPVVKGVFQEVDELSWSQRGSEGFGSTGIIDVDA